MATGQHEKEKQLYREISRTVTTAIPGVEVLALEITGRERFCVYVDQPGGVDHALCERVSQVLRPYLRPVRRSRSPHRAPSRRSARTRTSRAAEGHKVKVKTSDGKLRGEVVAAGERSFQLSNGPASRSTYRTTRSCGPI